MALPDPRRIAAADIYGTRGSRRRRQVLRAEFLLGATGSTALGIVTLIRGSGVWIIVGVWLVGIGATYLPLVVEAQRLSRRGALDAEMAGIDVRRELRAAARAQLWIAVPFAISLAGLAGARGRQARQK